MTPLETDTGHACHAGARRWSAHRLWPVAFILVMAGLVFGFGWHRYLSLGTLVAHRSALDALVSAHFAVSLAAFVALYVAVVSLSIPGAALLTISSGVLFGWVIGGSAVLLGATLGATILFLIARTAFGEHLVHRAG